MAFPRRQSAFRYLYIPEVSLPPSRAIWGRNCSNAFRRMASRLLQLLVNLRAEVVDERPLCTNRAVACPLLWQFPLVFHVEHECLREVFLGHALRICRDVVLLGAFFEYHRIAVFCSECLRKRLDMYKLFVIILKRMSVFVTQHICQNTSLASQNRRSADYGDMDVSVTTFHRLGIIQPHDLAKSPQASPSPEWFEIAIDLVQRRTRHQKAHRPQLTPHLITSSCQLLHRHIDVLDLLESFRSVHVCLLLGC